MIETKDGGLNILAWDFAEKDFVQGGAPEFDIFMEYESPGGGSDVTTPGAPQLGGADVRTVTEAEFNNHVAEIKQPKNLI